MSSTRDEAAAAATGRAATMPPQRLDFDDEQLATRPTVYRPGLFEGQAALVSGGGSGIGRATAFLLARLGARVMICGRTEKKLVETAASIGRLVGREVACKAMTIRDPDQVAGLVDETFARFGRLDLLVNNAGGQYAQEAIDFSVKGWNAVVDTNLNGTWYMMQAAARQWRARGEPGSIVNIVTTIERGVPHQAHSCAARAGVVHASRTVAVEWAPLRIRVNCVAPGMIATGGMNNYPPEMAERFGKGNPMRTMGDVWDIAEAIVYLAAPTGKFITGETLHVNGGSHLWGSSWALGVPDYFKVD